jgi:hypothetical protein
MMLPAVPQKSITIDKDKCLAMGVDYSAPTLCCSASTAPVS